MDDPLSNWTICSINGSVGRTYAEINIADKTILRSPIRIDYTYDKGIWYMPVKETEIPKLRDELLRNGEWVVSDNPRLGIKETIAENWDKAGKSAPPYRRPLNPPK